MEILSKTTGQTKEFAGKIAEKVKPGDVIFLYGDLGSGKTTFTKYLVESLGVDARVQSPTFVIMRQYTGGSGKIKTVYHFDLYRLTSAEEVDDLGISEINKEPNSLIVIEWPELAEGMLETTPITIKFESIDEDIRKIYVQNLD
jgi:tRNA threonylcarbamoyladenosine biosynthesis protein TsaE